MTTEKTTYSLALSGGGIRGMAHIGALQALIENGIEPRVIAGASSGALVGAFYAAGYEPQEILKFFEDTALFTFDKYIHRKPGILDTEKFYQVFKPFFPEDQFSGLEKKLFIVATDILEGAPRVFTEGPLIQAMLASAAFPFVLSPIEIDGSYYADGGIINNFPVELVKGKCQKTIGVFANPLPSIQPDELSSSMAVLERAFKIGMASMSIPKFEDCDILVAPEELSQFTTFNKDHIGEAYKIGYTHTQKALEASGIR